MRTFFSKLRLWGFSDIARATMFPYDMVSSKREFVAIWFIRLSFLVGRRLWHDKCPRQAAALAYQTMISMVPLAAIALSIWSYLSLETRVASYFEEVLLPSAAAEVGKAVATMASSVKPKALGIAGAGTLFLLAMTLVFTVEQVVNEIFRIKKPRGFPLRVAAALAIVLIAPMLFGFSIYYTIELASDLAIVRGYIVPFALTVVTLYLMYWLLPRTEIKVRYALSAAVAAGILLEIVKIGFATYVRYMSGTLFTIYGTFALLPLFLVWVYAAWLIFLFGAEFSAALHEVVRHDRFDLPRQHKR